MGIFTMCLNLSAETTVQQADELMDTANDSLVCTYGCDGYCDCSCCNHYLTQAQKDSLRQLKKEAKRNLRLRKQAIKDSLRLIAGTDDTLRYIHWAIKTNALADVVLIPNIGLELAIGRHLSVAADWHYAWWSNDTHHRFWQSYGGYLTFRYWLGHQSKPLHGHHIGVYGQMITHDVEFGGRGYQAANWCFGGGLEYGYSTALTHSLNLDFSIGLGYLDGKYKEYIPMDTHYVWQATKQRHWWGPTKAEVSLVWLIGHDIHNNKKKGGRR